MNPGPLRCKICPKRPNFSDVSHLLTHVASKAHLSHYFKLQVRSHQEADAGELLDEYDQWYKVNNLATLLSDRMAGKETRRKKPQTPSVRHSTSYPLRRNDEWQPVQSSSSRQPLPSCLDPRLSDPYLHAGEAAVDGGPGISGNYTTPSDSATMDSQAHPYSEYPFPPSTYPEGPLFGQWNRAPQPGPEVKVEPNVQTRRSLRNRTNRMGMSNVLRNRLGHDPFVDHDDVGGLPGPDKERTDEIARLKGVLWPGMDIFDSATEQMKRKRNQKKDESILRMMERTSLGVEPTELVFSPTGILRKQRVISGNVEDDSPLKGESPIPKRRSTRPRRGLLSQVDANIPHGRGRTQVGKLVGQERDRPVEEPSPFHLEASPSPAVPLPLRLSGYRAANADYDQIELATRAFNRGSRNGFAVFQDDEEPDQGAYNDHATRFAEPTPAPHGLPGPETPAPGPFPSPSPGGHPSKYPGRQYFPMETENIEPLLTVQGRMEPFVGWHSPFVKRRYPSDNGYLPQYFLNDPHRSGYGLFEGQDGLGGYACNPLAASPPKLPGKENHIYTTGSNPDYRTQSRAGTVSPDATISDIERDDFERLYLDGSSY